MESSKILLIENQYRQFIKIKTYLENAGYTVCPTDADSFNEFINYVRIYLNPRYGGTEEGSRRKKVFNKITTNHQEVFLFTDSLPYNKFMEKYSRL